MTLAQARQLLPDDMKDMPDSELSALLSQLYGFADLVLDLYFEKKGGGADA